MKYFVCTVLMFLSSWSFAAPERFYFETEGPYTVTDSYDILSQIKNISGYIEYDLDNVLNDPNSIGVSHRDAMQKAYFRVNGHEFFEIETGNMIENDNVASMGISVREDDSESNMVITSIMRSPWNPIFEIETEDEKILQYQFATFSIVADNHDNANYDALYNFTNGVPDFSEFNAFDSYGKSLSLSFIVKDVTNSPLGTTVGQYTVRLELTRLSNDLPEMCRQF